MQFFRCLSLRCLSTSAVLAARRSTTVGMGKKNVYAVVKGRSPGLYTSWSQCLLQVKGYPQNHYKGFESEQEALEFLKANGIHARGLEPEAESVPEPAAMTAAAPRKRRISSSAGRSKVAAAAYSSSKAAPGMLPATGRVFRLVRFAPF